MPSNNRSGNYVSPKTKISYSSNDAQRHRKMIENDESSFQAKRIHLNNLQAVINYCNNVSDCRRVVQLGYFGEVFDARHCKANSNSCDNCRSVSQKKDVTAFAKTILSGVELLRERGRFGSITVNQIAEVLRGSKNQKVRNGSYTPIRHPLEIR